MKPSQSAPAANFLPADTAKDFFPENLIQVAMVSGRLASEAIASGDIHGVSFTGSVPTGKLVYAAAENLIPAQRTGRQERRDPERGDDLENAIAQIRRCLYDFRSAMHCDQPCHCPR